MSTPTPDLQPLAIKSGAGAPPPPKTSSAPPPSSPSPPASSSSPPPPSPPPSSKSPPPKPASSPPPRSPPPSKSPPQAPPPKASSAPPPPVSPPPSPPKESPSPPPSSTPSSSPPPPSPTASSSPPPPASASPPPSSDKTPPASSNSPPPPPTEKSPPASSAKSPPESTGSPPTLVGPQATEFGSRNTLPESPLPPGTPTPPSPVNTSSPAPPTQNNSSAGGTPSISTQAAPSPPDQNGSQGLSVNWIVAISVGSTVFLIGLVALLVLLCKRMKKVAKHNEGLSSPSEPGGLGSSRSWFSYQELEEITNKFASQNLLGEGGFGAVYKGCLADGRKVAVKQLNVRGAQGEREFKAEVEIISRVHHRHLVSLVGYCISDNQRLLVYDYVPNNNLYYHLHGEGMPIMDWATRSRVAAGAARGIAYLHEDCHPRIIHRDIKSSNILLDDNFEALVSDFGLAKLTLDSHTHVTTRVMGTFGYMAPEYATSGKLTDKSDVFSFGVVLLELITGRKPVDTSQPLGEESLVEWARPLLLKALDTEELDGLVDPKLGREYVQEEMLRMIEAAAACVRHSATRRPRMGQVMRTLDSLGFSPDLRNGMRLGESGIYNDVDQSAEIRLFRRMAFDQDYSTELFAQSTASGECNRSL